MYRLGMLSVQKYYRKLLCCRGVGSGLDIQETSIGLARHGGGL